MLDKNAQAVNGTGAVVPAREPPLDEGAPNRRSFRTLWLCLWLLRVRVYTTACGHPRKRLNTDKIPVVLAQPYVGREQVRQIFFRQDQEGKTETQWHQSLF